MRETFCNRNMSRIWFTTRNLFFPLWREIAKAIAVASMHHERTISVSPGIMWLTRAPSSTDGQMFRRAGACELVTKSMSAFPDNIDVQHAACVAVGNLANRHAENKKKLGAAGACDKVGGVSARMQTFRWRGGSMREARDICPVAVL